MVRSFKVTFIFLLFCSLTGWAQERSVYGKIIDSTNHVGINNLIVLNKTSGQMVSTNTQGDFFIRAVPGDSVVVTDFGYNRIGILFNGENRNPVIRTQKQPYMLREVVIVEKRWKELQDEIDDFLDNPQNEGAIRKEILGNLLNSNTSVPGIGISIDGLYELWSKEGKLNRKLADMKYNDIKQFYVDLKYNPKLVMQITQLDEEEIDDFMEYCKPNETYLLRANNYDLTYHILNCLKEYRYSRILRKVK